MTARRRRLPFGAEIEAEGVRFRLWAPAQEAAAVALGDGRRQRMQRDEDGFFQALMPDVVAGARYRLELASGETVPDPASRFQPADIEGASEVIDPVAYAWTDDAWTGRPWNEAFVYELHVGCFGVGGGYDGVRARLDHLAQLGITAVELMPLADFPGRHNWGYDGVLAFAPDSSYGRPQALKRLVDACHARGLMVLLDVVYNHFGPSGNYLARYAPDFFHPEIHTPWGAALAFDNPVLRRFFIENALYWLQEYHIDGLRLDAVHAIEAVPGGAQFLRELAECVRAETSGREAHLILENDRNEAHWLPHSARPSLYTAQWNDDFHHAAHVLATGERDGYYADYIDAPVRHLARTLAKGFAFQGETSTFRGGCARGEPSAAAAPAAFVNFLQNHDQVGNRAFGARLGALAEPRCLRGLYALLFLAPHVPLLFMGEEWNAATPFLYFCDFSGALGEAVRTGRRNEFAGFAAFRDPAARERIPDPTAKSTFERSRLDWGELQTAAHREWLAFVTRLAACRRVELLPHLPHVASGEFTMLGEDAFAARWPLARGGWWQLEANFGTAPVAASIAATLVYADPAGGDGLMPGGVRASRHA